ncbi:hypothetical protein Agub_g3797 [Astrephomene gubernaculifera]|uniref:Protein kinase domain-containing protein n=1 Tax=Astrephomene gubernaculifera TaxID=47775 RepID=A0AAD3DJ77_9CHLO|nr:hypothetical protein Agub_g3797 [Astrephomene gubernaculifera]
MGTRGPRSVVASGVVVPEWAVVTGASTIADTVSVGVPAGAINAQGSQEDSVGQVSSPFPSRPNSNAKSGRPSAVRNPPHLPTDSASGARQGGSAKGVDPHSSDKGVAAPSHKNSCEVKTIRATGTGGGNSPLSSLRQHSYKSAIPEMPVAWQYAAGIKSSSTLSSTDSSCCGLVRSRDGTSLGRVPLCTLAWWRALAHGFGLELKKVGEVVRSRPVVLLPGLVVLGVVLGLGLWALVAASDSETRFRHESALKIAQDKAMYIQTELDKTFMPAYVVSATVQQNPEYYPTQPSNLRQLYPNAWYLMNSNFDKMSKDLIALVQAGSVRTVSSIPHGVIRTMYPLNGTTTADDRNWGAIGKNWLNDAVNAAFVKLSLSSRNLTIIGPYNLTQGGIGIVGMQAIFVPGTQNDTFGIPPGPDNVSGPTSSIPGMMNLTWQPSYAEAPKFWGLCTVLISWDALRDNVTHLQDLESQGYSYVLTRPQTNGTDLAVDWSSDIDPPRPPGFNETIAGKRPLIYYDLPAVLQEPVVVSVVLPNVKWTLYVGRTDGWVPSWRAPLIVMVVIVSLILSLLVFAVLVSRVQQRRLFRDVVEAAGQLANTSRTLEEEKNRMQALLARHYDLIDLLEGGGGAIAASIAGGGGGGAGGGDDGGGTRLDILRQKMLLTGTSVRREQLGEAEQITILEKLGEGTFGKVYRGLWRGTEVAIKTIVLPANMSGKEKREKMAVMEAAISSSLAHPNIVQTYTYHIRPLRDSSAAQMPAAVQQQQQHLLPPTTPGSSHMPSSRAGGGTAGGTTAGDTAGGGGTTAAAGGPAAGGGSSSAVAPAAVLAAGAGGGKGVVGAIGATGTTQMLAGQGAIIVGSPDSSISITATTSASAAAAATTAVNSAGNNATASNNNNNNNNSNNKSNGSNGTPPSAAGTGSGGGAGSGGGGAPPAKSGGKSPTPPTSQPQQLSQPPPSNRGVSMDQPAGATGSIHSYEVQLVLEFCDKGCLREALDAGAFFSQQGLNYPAILDTAADVAKAMLHLHCNDVLHSDLKATNVMLKSAGSETGRGVVAKVADFGLSVRLDHTATHVSHTFQGSLTHMAPEVMLEGHISRAADVFAFGITMWEIFTSGHPYRGTPGALLGHQTSREGRRPVFPPGTPLDYRQLAERCWAAEASKRPTFTEILESLTRMRADIPGPTPPLQPVAPLHKKMQAALQQQQQQQQAGGQQQGMLQGMQQPQQQVAGQAGGVACSDDALSGLNGIIIGTGSVAASTDGVGSGINGLMYGNGGGGGSSTANASTGTSMGGGAVVPLPKLQGGPASIQVGSRFLSLSAAMHSADAHSLRGSGAAAASSASLGGLNSLGSLGLGLGGIPGVLETIVEEAATSTHTATDNTVSNNNTAATTTMTAAITASASAGTTMVTAASAAVLEGSAEAAQASSCGPVTAPAPMVMMTAAAVEGGGKGGQDVAEVRRERGE